MVNCVVFLLGKQVRNKHEIISKVLEFSECIVPSFVEVRVTDGFRDYLLPAAVSLSSQTLRDVTEELRNTSEFVACRTASLLLTICLISALPVPTVQYALPHTAEDFVCFKRYLPIADSLMWHVYGQLRGLIQPIATSSALYAMVPP